MKPTYIRDALADQTTWSPLVPGGTNFRTRQLAEIGPMRLEYKALRGAVLFAMLFVTIGLVTALTPFVYASFFDFVFEIWMPIALLAGSLCFAIGGAFLLKDVRRVGFDKAQGVFIRGRTRISLADVRAVQIVGEALRTGGMYTAANFQSYEINLVLRDADRTNVVDHGDELDRVHEEASKLAEFLSVPLWDATLQRT